MRSFTHRRRSPSRLLILLLASCLWAGESSAQTTLSAVGDVGSTVDHSAAWDSVDRSVDLTGLWGSIDPYLDADPYLYTRPSDGRLYLFWAKWNGLFSEIVYAFRDPGGSWSLLQKVQPNPDSTLNNISPNVKVGASGYLNVAWTRVTAAGGAVYHAVRIGSGWTLPQRVSGSENARKPCVGLDHGETRITYRTPFEAVTVRVVIWVSEGGTDDIDPTQEGEVQVDYEEVFRTHLEVR